MSDDLPKWILSLLEELRKVREPSKTSPQKIHKEGGAQHSVPSNTA